MKMYSTQPVKLPPWHPGRPSRGPGRGCSQTTTVGAPVSDPNTTGAPPITERGDKVLCIVDLNQNGLLLTIRGFLVHINCFTLSNRAELMESHLLRRQQH